MERPRDLPLPVREHSAHQIPSDGTGLASPGPAAYDGYGVTRFDRDRRLGIFMSSREHCGIPTKRGPMATLKSSTPGPIYDVHAPGAATRLSTAIARERRFAADDRERRVQGGPGPGAYYDAALHQSTVDRAHVTSVVGTMPRADRLPFARGGGMPSAADYTPNVAPTRVHHGAVGFPTASVRHRNASAAAHCETSDVIFAGPEEIERAEAQTRRVHCAVVAVGAGATARQRRRRAGLV